MKPLTTSDMAPALLDLEALVSSTRKMAVGSHRLAIDPVAFNDAREVLASEIMALAGCDERAAGKAAGSYLSSPALPQSGLGDWSEGQYLATVNASAALDRWMTARGL